ncbi:transcriptional regulatory moc3 [Fusarium circinatum]|uniref:Transcriptional regulatory moc3 n=1 Tax=Fusarium circinatum TaxID=48490 RepID=A0A8H5UMI9_FUSCI|nr:transcriptional regulatory moc3 [Fusarium circinatum]
MSRVISPPPEMSLIAFQGDFCFAFLFSNFVWRSYGAPWLDQAAAGKLGSLSLDATKALSRANFGRSNHKSDIELKGIVQYGKCLSTLAGALGSNTTQRRQELLIPILVLLMHSVSAEAQASRECNADFAQASYSDQTGAVSHLRGLARLLHLCGPEAFQEQPFLNAFEATRATLLVASLYVKQRLFLEDERWRIVPYERNNAPKTPQSQLLDILVVVPGILQDYSALRTMDEDGTHTKGELLARVETQMIALYRWRWQWQAHSRNHIESDVNNTPQLNGRAADALGSIGYSRQSGRLGFRKFALATDLMLYNATLMWLIALQWKIGPVSASSRIEACADAAMPDEPATRYLSFQPLRRPGASVTVRDPTMEICRVFEWVTSHHSRSKEPTFLYLFPIGMAMSALETEPEAKAWVTDLLNKSPITANYASGQNAGGFGFYITPEALNPETDMAKHQLFSSRDIQQLVA